MQNLSLQVAGAPRSGRVERRPDGRLDRHVEGDRDPAHRRCGGRRLLAPDRLARPRGAAHAGNGAAARPRRPPRPTTRCTSPSARTPVSVDVSVKSGDSLQTIADKINSTSGTPGLRVVDERQARALRQADRRRELDLGHRRRGRDRPRLHRDAERPQNADFWVGTTHYTDKHLERRSRTRCPVSR